MYTDTIAAIATPAGEGALGLVRLSGPQALAIAQGVFTGRLRDRRVVAGRLVDPASGRTIDEVLATYMAGPRSYTGEDTVEFSCHGGALPVRTTLELLLRQGARAAHPGEFTLRAFLNGRIDLAQAEAVMDVVTARTQRALDAALAGLQGRFSQRVTDCRSQVLDVLAYVTAMVDFPEEGVDPQQVDPPLRAAAAALDALLATAHEGALLRQGVQTALVGLPNAGKSSLLNALLGWERAIVAERPGTTRDTITETLSIEGMPFVLTDTAGIAATADPVEGEGVARSQQQAATADLLLLVVDGNAPGGRDLEALATGLDRRRCLLVVNKADLPHAVPPGDLAECLLGPEARWLTISARTGLGLDTLRSAMVEAALRGATPTEDERLVTNPRHAALLRHARQALDAALGRGPAAPADLLAIDLAAAVNALGEITGETATEDLLDRVFSRFCIGK